ncbi:MAG: COR domain-containing protein [Cyanobacteria bacterium P01_F01_bin.53]
MSASKSKTELLALIDQAAEEGWTELDLSGKGLTMLPPKIGNLTKLTTLYLDRNQLTEISESLSSLSNLTTLSLSSNQLTEIPESLSSLSNLTQFSLSSNQLTEISESLSSLSNLTHLYLSSNQLQKIPENLSLLSNLTHLSLNRNQLTEISESLSLLSNLTHLSLDSNQLIEISRSLSSLSNLTHLSLDSNQLMEIPESLSSLSNLMHLSLYRNQLTEIPESLSSLSHLTHLSLSSNRLTKIPETLSSLSNLTHLYLNRNQLTEIPESLSLLSNLTHLYLNCNQLTEIPESLSLLSNLTQLSLDSNQLTEIPESLSLLSNLTQLSLDSNQLAELPENLDCLTQLERLDLFDNLLPISPEILGGTHNPGAPAEIFSYYSRMRSGEVRPLNEAKLLLVGQGSVGKTSLIERLLHDRYDTNQPQTDGLNVLTWGVQVNSKAVQLNVWDFGGQEVYHSTHQFFLTKRSLYILTCNCRTSEEENRIEYWLKLIKSFGGESPVIIVGNKCDEQPLDIQRNALRKKYPNIKAILETSCSTGDGIDELRTAIEKEVAKMDDVYNLLPLSWFQVKEQLEAMNQDFISYSEYLKVCFNNDVHEESDQEQIIDLLHNLGLVLNFREHPILKGTNVLNPDWVTEGIYALLSDDTLKTTSKGVLTYADLTRVLSPDRYPEKRHTYLTTLMQEFELCYKLPNCSNTSFLIPGLLPKDEPDDISLPGESEGDTLEFQYHYRVLSGSILSRFIVNAHEKIYEGIQWRNGVMLAYCDGSTTPSNIARIKADTEDKKIFITINGSPNTRRLFLGLIRDTFNRIHNSFASLEITECVPVPGHPEHPPLDYQELLGLEAMGEQEYPIGKLRIKVNLRQLLDGYESVEARRMSQREDWEKEGMMIGEEMAMRRGMMPNITLNIDNNSSHQTVVGNKNNTSQTQGNDNITRQTQSD